MAQPALGPFNLDRIYRAVDNQRERLRRATSVLEQAAIPYAVVGGSAVASWISRVDASAVRFTQDVDILLRRADLQAAIPVLEAAGIDMFLDGEEGKFRDVVHVIFAGERMRQDYVAAAPDVSESEAAEEYRVITLPALVTMKLTSFRRKDQVHLQDMIDVGLIDATWTARLPSELASRLQELLDTPDG